MIHSITFTPEDIQAIQNTVKKLPKGTYTSNPEYEPFEHILTDNNSPLDFFLLSYGLLTYNEYSDCNVDYVGAQESYILDNISYRKAFVGSLTKAEKENFIANTNLFDDALKIFTDEQREAIIEGDCKIEDLVLEYRKDIDDMYADIEKVFLYGDYQNEGAIPRLGADFQGIKYDIKNDILHIDYDDEIESQNENNPQTSEVAKMHLLQWGKNRIIERKEKQKKELEKRKQERQEKEKRHIAYVEWQKQKLIDELSK